MCCGLAGEKVPGCPVSAQVDSMCGCFAGDDVTNNATQAANNFTFGVYQFASQLRPITKLQNIEYAYIYIYICFYIFATNITCGRNSNCIYVQNNKHICYIYIHIGSVVFHDCSDTSAWTHTSAYTYIHNAPQASFSCASSSSSSTAIYKHVTVKDTLGLPPGSRVQRIYTDSGVERWRGWPAKAVPGF